MGLPDAEFRLQEQLTATLTTEAVAANRLGRSDSRGLCGVVLGRNDILRAEPARLQVREEQPLERWACRIL